jgi:hypothetical protein
VRDILATVCAENGTSLDDLSPAILLVAVEHLVHLAQAVAEDDTP